MPPNPHGPRHFPIRVPGSAFNGVCNAVILNRHEEGAHASRYEVFADRVEYGPWDCNIRS